MHYILKDENAIYYEVGFSCDNALLIVVGEEKYFITDPRYTTEAKEHIRGAEVIEAKELVGAASALLRRLKPKKLYYDPKELGCIELAALQKLPLVLAKRPHLSWKKRMIKTEEEIELLQTSARLNRRAFDDFASFLCEAEGMSEKRLQFEAKRVLSRYGEYDLSFEPIVALNENAAKPHATASSKKLQRGDLLLFDAGIKYRRYCSDRTRTSFYGKDIKFTKEQNFSSKRVQKAYDIVRKAQEEAIKRARPGMMAKEIDRIARDIIDKSEFQGTFVHSLGHGVGLDIHEMPFINSKNEQILEEGMVFTIEPGIYIPNEFGIRIEDMVVLQESYAKVL